MGRWIVGALENSTPEKSVAEVLGRAKKDDPVAAKRLSTHHGIKIRARSCKLGRPFGSVAVTDEALRASLSSLSDETSTLHEPTQTPIWTNDWQKPSAGIVYMLWDHMAIYT